jgi:hypothetical protein
MAIGVAGKFAIGIAMIGLFVLVRLFLKFPSRLKFMAYNKHIEQRVDARNSGGV